ncbi:alpha/beta hydrolase [Herbiconiux sp. YIM B11900]|uniref:alpha/beta hydrolase n=1 Tax=Herbiconiux sp. YIM B11900 TaxID=3404131 RepID=UPI003F86C5BA
MSRRLTAIVSTGLEVDTGLLEQVLTEAAAPHGVPLRLVWLGPGESWSEAIRDDASASGFLLLPGDDVDLGLETDSVWADRGDGSVVRGPRPPIVRVDLGLRDPDPSSALLHHVRGSGLDSLRFVVSSVVAAAAHPAQREPYGPGPDQYGEWREPEAAHRSAPTSEGPPLAVLLHGGFYRSRWQAGLMDELAVDLARRGWRSWNLEYRRPDQHGWAATIDDLHAGLARARELAGASAGPIVLVGHSAGGQLALQLAEETAAAAGGRDAEPGVRLAVSLAGVVDLVAAHDRFLGEGAVGIALGGTPSELPEIYAAASPQEFRDRATSWLLVQGSDDSADLVEMNRRLSNSVRLDRPELIEAPGHHFSVIDPRSPIWETAWARVTAILDAGAGR